MRRILYLIILFCFFFVQPIMGTSLSDVYGKISRDEYAPAFRALKTMLQECKDKEEKAEILYLLGQCADNANDASFYYKEVLKVKKNAYIDRSYVQLAKISLTHEDWDSALEYADKLLKKTISLYYSEALFFRAQAYFCKGEYFPAITSYKEFMNISLDSSQRELALLNCGTSYYELKQYRHKSRTY